MQHLLDRLFKFDVRAEVMHDLKDTLTTESARVQLKQQQVNRVIEQSTAYKYAVATGGEKRGLRT